MFTLRHPIDPSGSPIDIGKLTLSAAKAVADLVTVGSTLNFGGTVDGIRQIIDGFRDKDLKPEQLAYQMWVEVLMGATQEAIRASGAWTHLAPKKIDKHIQEFHSRSITAMDAEEFFERDLIDPAQFSGFMAARTYFADLLAKVAPTEKVIAEEAGKAFDVGLRYSLGRLWADRYDTYAPLFEFFKGPVAEGARRLASWQQHYDWIRGRFEREPTFGQEVDSGVTLSRLYVRLRCCHHELADYPEGEAEDDPHFRRERRKKVIAHVGDLHETMEEWLARDDPRDTIRIVAGGPGSGKSSFATAFAHEVSARGEWDVAFIQLQHLQPRSDLEQELEGYFHRRPVGAGLHESPLDWLKDSARPLLLVFDGLDELAPSDEGQADLTARFVDKVKRVVDPRNGETVRVKAVVLGRSVAAQAARREADIALDRLLHVLPLRPLTERDLSVSLGYSAEPNEIADTGSLVERDQRAKDYWPQHASACRMADIEAPEAITHKDLQDLSAEPLLLYLLIFSGYTEEVRWREAAENRNRVYEAIFRKVWERDRAADKKHQAGKGIDSEEDFFTLMEALGLATWAGGGRTASEEDFCRIRAAYAPDREEAFARLAGAALGNVALQFYTREDLGDAPGYEFVHKSFGEYLIGRAIVRLACGLSGLIESGRVKLFMSEWVSITGDGLFTWEIARVVFAEVSTLPPEKAKSVIALLNRALTEAVHQGFDVRVKDSLRSAFKADALATHALMGVISAFSYRLIDTGWDDDALVSPDLRDDPGALRRLLSYLDAVQDGHSTAQMMTALSCAPGTDLTYLRLNNASLRGARLNGVRLMYSVLVGADLRAADLRKAALSGARLSHARMSNVNLSHGILVETVLYYADLTRAEMRNCNMRGAALSGATMIRADCERSVMERVDLGTAVLNNANLTQVDLSFSDLRAATLMAACLDGADLSSANMTDATLDGADLTRAKVYLADFSGASLKRCRLHSVDLSKALGLTQAQIDYALGNCETKLPTALRRPHHWAEDNNNPTKNSGIFWPEMSVGIDR